jgi:hypothetical protein
MIFKYKARSVEGWINRASQKFDGAVSDAVARKFAAGLQGASAAVVAAPPEPAAVVAAPPEPENGEGFRRPAKKGTRTLCVDCGHEQGQHHMHPSGHHADGNWLFYCISSHCCAQVRNPDRTFSACTCLYFRATPETVPELTRPAVDDWTPCASCGHWRSKHCTKRKVDSKKSLSQTDWKGLEDENNLPVPCSHTPENPIPYACSSSACATVLGEGDAAHFCDCQKFVSPFLKKKPAKQPKIKSLIPVVDLERAHQNFLAEQQPKPKTKEVLLLEVAAECDLSALTAKEVSEITGMSPAWVRKHLKAVGITLAKPSRKRATAFVTGEALQVNQ